MTPRRAQLVIQPNASLAPRQAVLHIMFVAAGLLTIGSFFASRGLWLVFPFCLLNGTALVIALTNSLKHNHYREVVSFDSSGVVVKKGSPRKGVVRVTEMRRSYTRVFLERGPYRNSHSTLYLVCGNKSCELGRCLTDQQRADLARKMRDILHPGWTSAAAESRPIATSEPWQS